MNTSFSVGLLVFKFLEEALERHKDFLICDPLYWPSCWLSVRSFHHNHLLLCRVAGVLRGVQVRGGGTGTIKGFSDWQHSYWPYCWLSVRSFHHNHLLNLLGLLVFYEVFKFLEEALERQKDSLIGDILIDHIVDYLWGPFTITIFFSLGLLVFYEVFKFLEEALERHKDSLIGDPLIDHIVDYLWGPFTITIFFSLGLLVFYEVFKFLEEALERHEDSLIGDLLIPGMARTAAFEVTYQTQWLGPLSI